MSVLLETSFGDVVVDLDVSSSPRTSQNFLLLCAQKVYNDAAIFHISSVARVARSPSSMSSSSAFGMAYGAQAAAFPREDGGRRHEFGAISMACVDGRIGREFFLCVAEGERGGLEEHAAFGCVGEGGEVLKKMREVAVDGDGQPYRPVRVRHCVVLHDPFPRIEGLGEVPDSPEPVQDSEDEAESGDEEARKEARSRAEVLEMLGDVEDADVAPPENVLFVCKLNKVTGSEDLEIIFSRFGECAVDVLREKESGESLGYGFVEFEKKEAAERAFFKMDQALVDDRRIKVDFSQSVSRLWNDRRRRRSKRSGTAQGASKR